MDRGTYSAASAGLVNFRKLEVQNNNLANINTAGFKRQFITGSVQNFADTFANALKDTDPYAEPDHERTPGVVNIKTVTDFTLGPIKNTGNPLDVALSNPNDFLVVGTPDGNLYTRAGDLTLDSTGNLVTQDGYSVLGDGGPITAQGVGVNIGPDGSVTASGQVVGRLQVARFNDPQVLERVGATRFKLPAGEAAPQTVEDPELVTQSLEMANVSAVSSMIDLVLTNRAFEAYTKAAQTIDQLNQMSVGQVGRRQ